MFWYLFICVFMFYPFLLVYVGKKHGVNTQKIALQLSTFVLMFFMALRDPIIGVDTKYYCYIFEQLRDTPVKKIFSVVTYGIKGSTWVVDLEKGYRFYNKVIGIFFDSSQMITVVNSCIILMLLYFLIKKKSKDYFLSIWLYLTLGLFQTEMNVSRNAIAILICYHALDYIAEKKFWKYIIWVCIAATIHKSVLVFIPLYFLFKKPIPSGKRMRLIIGISSVVGIGCMVLAPYIQNIIPMGLGKYLMASNEKTESLLVGGFYIAIVFFIWFMMKRSEKEGIYSACSTGMWMFTLNIACFGLNIGFKMAARVAGLFGVYIIILVPDLIHEIKSEKRRKTVTILLILGCGLQYILRMMINNIGGTMPYSFFW